MLKGDRASVAVEREDRTMPSNEGKLGKAREGLPESISRSGAARPLYHQLVEILRMKILEGRLEADSRLPTEARLCERFDVSRATVREAFRVLLHEGLITRYAGKGTFVRRKTEAVSVELKGNLEDAIALGEKVEIRRIDFSTETPPQEVRRALRLRSDERATLIRSVSSLGGIPLQYSLTYLPERIGRILQNDPECNRPFSRLIEIRLGVRLQNCRQIIRAIQAKKDIAKYLQLPPGDPILFVERLSYYENGTPLHLLRSYFAGDRYLCVVHLTRGG